MGNFFTHCRLIKKFRTRVRLKPSNNRCDFELDRTRSKNNIAENSFALGHETDNRIISSNQGRVHIAPHVVVAFKYNW